MFYMHIFLFLVSFSDWLCEPRQSNEIIPQHLRHCGKNAKMDPDNELSSGGA